MTDHSALIERLEGWPMHPNGADYSVASIQSLMTEAAEVIRETMWRPIEDHDNSAAEVIIETDKGAVMIAWRHHPSRQTDIWLSVPGRYQVKPVRFQPRHVWPIKSPPPLPSAPSQAKEA